MIDNPIPRVSRVASVTRPTKLPQQGTDPPLGDMIQAGYVV